MKKIILIGASHSAIRQHIDTDCIIHVIEPIKSNCELLSKFFDTSKLKIYNYAMGKKDGFIDINLSMSWDSHSIHKMKKDFDYYWEIVKQTGDVERVKILSWDNFINRFDLYNIDICIIDAEGAEGDILRGMTNELPNKIFVSHYHSNIFEGVETAEILKQMMINLGYKNIKKLDEELEGVL